MKVKELIETFKNFNENLEVIAIYDGMPCPITEEDLWEFTYKDEEPTLVIFTS